MSIILAALFFGLITLGFTLLTVVPFVFLFLLLGVYREPRAHPAAADDDLPAHAPLDIVRRQAAPDLPEGIPRGWAREEAGRSPRPSIAPVH
jgi:hypothetical protein